MWRFLTIFLLLGSAAAWSGEFSAQADADGKYAEALLRDAAGRPYARALIDELLRQNHPDGLRLLARYNAIRSPGEIRSDANAAGGEKLAWLNGVAPGASADPDGDPGMGQADARILAEARRLGAEALQRGRLAAEQMEKTRLAVMEAEKERQRREAGEAEERKRRDFAAREEREHAEQLEAAREESDRVVRLAQEDERKRQEELERLGREREAAKEENEQDIRYVEAVFRHLPRFEPHAAVLMFRLMDQSVPAGGLLYERHRQLRPGVDLERFRKYSQSDVELARGGVRKLLDEEARAIARELQAEEEKFRLQQNAIEMLLQDTNNIKKVDVAGNTVWLDPRTWQALDKEVRLLLLRGVAAHFMDLHKSAVPYGYVRSFADNSLLGEMDGQNTAHVY